MNCPNSQAYNHTNTTIIRIGIARRERGCDSENFGTRITLFRVTAEKIWRFEVLGAKIRIWKVLGLISEFARALVKRICNLYEVEGLNFKIGGIRVEL
jgi:hypothetical protein